MASSSFLPDHLPQSADIWRQLTRPETAQDYVMAGIYVTIILVVVMGLWKIYSNDS